MADKKISALTGATTPLAGTEVLPIVQGGATVKVAVSDLTAGRSVSMKSLEVTDSGATGGVIRLSNSDNDQTVGDVIGRVEFYSADADDPEVKAYVRAVVLDAFGRDGYLSFGTTATGGVVTENMTLGTTGDATLKTGNLVQGTAAKGVNFTANTPAAGMTSQLLNWYEEVTAASTACTGAITTAASWTLTRVGNVITLTLPPITGAATSSAYFEFGVVVPSGYRPASSLLFPCGVRDNDANQSTVGMCIVTSSGNIRIYPNIAASANFTANVSATAAGFAQGCGFSCSWRL